jgi:hypothetical protein
MKRLATLLAAAALAAAPAAAQTIKSLGFNTTNGNVVYSGTNVLTFTNALSFGTNAAQTRTNLGGTTVGDAVFTATNAAAAATAIGLGATNEVTFESVGSSGLFVSIGTNDYFYVADDMMEVYVPMTIYGTYGISFATNVAAAQTRTNLGLGLPALTNTSNVTMMRALAGSTNTNQPFSGMITVQEVGELDDTIQITISNGIIVKAEP